MSSEPAEWRKRSDGSVWVTGMVLTPDHVNELRGVRYLTLYDTRVQPGVLSELGDLELLDLRTASVASLDQIRALPRLRGLALAHNRKVVDLAVLETLQSLEHLELYGSRR